MRGLVSVFIAGLTLAAPAQTIVINSFPGNGSLSWNGDATNFAQYHVEWAPTLTGPWSASWTNLTNLIATNGTMTASVPMFYRVVGRLRPLGDTCENAATNGPGTYLGTTVGFVNDFNPATSPAPGRDRAYRVTIPPYRMLTATLAPTNAPLLDVVLLLYSGEAACDVIESNLLAAADLVTVDAETLNWSNNTATPTEVMVVADSFTAEPAGEYVLTLAFVSTLPGDICETATTLVAGTANDLTTVNYALDQTLGANCAPSTGADRYFQFAIPNGQTLTTTVDPTSAWDVVINIVAVANDCAAPADCLAGVDAAGASGVETVSYTNNTGSTLDVFILVSGFTPGDAGTFDLTTALTP
jgi:hypothetical protein